MPGALAQPQDVADAWRPLSDVETDQVFRLIDKASAKLRQACPFDIDARMALRLTAPTDPTALDPLVVADVVATMVKRFLVNVEGVASYSDGVGPYNHSATLVNRYDKTGSDVRGAIQATESDIDQLRPAVPAPIAGVIAVNVPRPRVLLPNLRRPFGPGVGREFGSEYSSGYGSANGYGTPPDFQPGSGVE